MEYNSQEGICECRFCKHPGKSSRKSDSRSSSKPPSSKPKGLGIRGRPPLKRGPVDDEGNPNVICRFLSILQQEGHIDRRIEERTCMDWRVETLVYEDAKQLRASQSSFVPRIGELVLFHRGIAKDVRPVWLGGIITQVPIHSEPVHLNDMTQETPKEHSINSSGFRIECYPNPNTRDKSFSKQYSYVPMHHIRPMMLLHDVLKGVRIEDWHPTVQHVMTAMGSVSCVARYKIKGDWPNFSMFCDGLYLGSEAIWAGEPLRLMPRGTEKAVIDVMVPDFFVVRVHNVEPEPDGSITGNRAKKIHLLAVGHVYTIDQASSEGPLTEATNLHPTMRGYGPWYHKSRLADEKYETSFTCLLGRLYTYEATQKWYPALPPREALNLGMASVRTSRAYATSYRTDYSGTHLGWYWGEDRAASLDLATFNGIEVGEYDREREPNKWREILAVLDGFKDRLVVEGPPPPPSTSNADNKAGISHRKSSLVAPPMAQVDGEGGRGGPVREVIDLDDDDDDDDDDDAIDGFGRGEEEKHAAKRPRMA
ncbi:MAG: hypothetical protein Q9195_007432 [Heterodermia aff. obscurata]